MVNILFYFLCIFSFFYFKYNCMVSINFRANLDLRMQEMAFPCFEFQTDFLGEYTLRPPHSCVVYWPHMSAYLLGRRQRVRVENTYSQWRIARAGVPQGSLLGPLLFNIFMNDINYYISITSLRLYADDTTDYASDISPMVLEYIINQDLRYFSRWVAIKGGVHMESFEKIDFHFLS